MPVDSRQQNASVFSWVLQNKTSKVLTQQAAEHWWPSALKQLLPKGDCFVAPILLGSKVIAVFYADNAGQLINDEQVIDAQMVLKQSNLVVNMLLSARK